jgi:hypothetical protein
MLTVFSANSQAKLTRVRQLGRVFTGQPDCKAFIQKHLRPISPPLGTQYNGGEISRNRLFSRGFWGIPVRLPHSCSLHAHGLGANPQGKLTRARQLGRVSTRQPDCKAFTQKHLRPMSPPLGTQYRFLLLSWPAGLAGRQVAAEQCFQPRDEPRIAQRPAGAGVRLRGPTLPPRPRPTETPAHRLPSMTTPRRGP